MTLRPLPTSTPSAQGVDASRVLAFLDALEAAEAVEPHSVMILRHGRVVAAGWWAPYRPDRPQLLYSVSKSFTATAAGFAVAEGLIGLDDPVVSYFPEFEADITDPRSRAMRVRHLPSMTSGHEAETYDRARALDQVELVRGFLLLPPDRDPGTVFAYNQPATFTLAAILQRVTGQSLTAYLRPRLLDPLGIGEVGWLKGRSGRELGFSGLHGATDALARLGQLYLDEGVWEGKRLLSREWVAEATRAHLPTAGYMGDAGGQDAEQRDWDLGYGFSFWQSRHGYRADGAYGQFCVVLPEHDAVIATTAAAADMQALLDLVWEHLLPAFGPEPLTGRDAADAALAERLTRLALTPAAGSPVPPERAEQWSDAEFTPYGGVCAGQPGLSGAVVTVDADGWALTLVEDGHRLRAAPGAGGWRVTDEPLPLAVSGGWTDGDTLAVDLVLLETPHRLRVTCSLADRTFTARWDTAPLHGGPLRSLRAPRP
ncbi:beta-lactamase family protein [Streptomyces sp. NBC_01275]|uniref:serine hydrolase domain-containing protein n=1 Tax=Streptomyces sp. NBC_01275 TaxID=2903807 RepID=UPI00224D4862|nr:serine hydrolase domain-containing protein [Streptomyces sp. NBC_01275]MCX4767539.1 beta-lactamase family protein [Streptomyces sp. NBC_01275]